MAGEGVGGEEAGTDSTSIIVRSELRRLLMGFVTIKDFGDSFTFIGSKSRHI